MRTTHRIFADESTPGAVVSVTALRDGSLRIYTVGTSVVLLPSSEAERLREFLCPPEAPAAAPVQYPVAPDHDLAGYMAPCPPGYGTVLGHLVQRGEFPEDMGVSAGYRLSAAAKLEGVASVWVEASPALEDFCDRVRAYPAAFLEKHLGPVANPWRAAA